MHLKSFRSHYGPGVDSASNRNEYQEYCLGGKGGRCVRLTLPPSCAVVTKSGNLNFLEPSGPVQACNGTALPFTVCTNGEQKIISKITLFETRISHALNMKITFFWELILCGLVTFRCIHVHDMTEAAAQLNSHQHPLHTYSQDNIVACWYLDTNRHRIIFRRP